MYAPINNQHLAALQLWFAKDISSCLFSAAYIHIMNNSLSEVYSASRRRDIPYVLTKDVYMSKRRISSVDIALDTVPVDKQRAYSHRIDTIDKLAERQFIPQLYESNTTLEKLIKNDTHNGIYVSTRNIKVHRLKRKKAFVLVCYRAFSNYLQKCTRIQLHALITSTRIYNKRMFLLSMMSIFSTSSYLLCLTYSTEMYDSDAFRLTKCIKSKCIHIMMATYAVCF